MNLNMPPHAVRAADTNRVDLLLIAEMVTPGARVLDIGCGDGTLAALACREARRGRPRHRAEPSGGELLRGARPVRDPGRRRHRPCLLPGPRLRLRHSVADHSGDLFAAPCAGAALAHRQAGRGLLPQFRPLARQDSAHVRGQDAEDRQFAGPMVRHAEHPSLHHQGLPRAVQGCRRKVERAVALNAYGRKLGVSMPLFAQNLFGEQAVFLLSR